MFELWAREPLSKAAPTPTSDSPCKSSRTVIEFCFLSEVGVGLLKTRRILTLEGSWEHLWAGFAASLSV